MLTLASILPPQAFTRYDSSDKPYFLASERILVALRTLGWAAYSDAFAALDASTPKAQQRARLVRMISRCRLRVHNDGRRTALER